MESIGERKRGDTLSFYATITDKTTNEPIVTDVSNIKSQMRTLYDDLVDTFAVSKTETDGKYFFLAKGDPKKYPIATLQIDIEIDYPEVTSSTDTFTITIVQDVTH